MRSLSYRLFSCFIKPIPLKAKLNFLFFRRFKRFINFKNPKTFNEKLQFRKLYDRNPLFPVLADKIASKDYVRDIIGERIYIPKTLLVLNGLNQVESLKTINQDFVLKANHTSQTIIFVRDGNLPEMKSLRKTLAWWLREDQFKTLGEWAYSPIQKHVFAEELLDFEGTIPDDYKFFVFDGRVEVVQVDLGRFENHRRNMYDRDFNLLDFSFSHPMDKDRLSKPINYDEMVAIAEDLGSGFDFLRVDLFSYKGMPTFSEITIYPGAGFERFPSTALDRWFGQFWKLKIHSSKG